MKYPAIYRSVVNENVFLLFNEKQGVVLDKCETIIGTSGKWNEFTFKNITAEYLANTYGEVKSKEHAEFIVKLAEVNGIQVSVNCRDGNAKVFSFRTKSGMPRLVLLSTKDHLYNTVSRKQITIPLPPECEARKPKDVIANGKKHTLNSVTGFYDFSVIDLGYASGSTLEKLQEADDYQVISFVDDSLDNEWPKVNDTVSLRYRFDSKQVMYTGELLYLSSNHIIIKTENGNDCHCIRSEWDIEKPKTPEQELRDELISDFREIGQSGIVLIGMYDKVVDEFLSKYNVTKKPQ